MFPTQMFIFLTLNITLVIAIIATIILRTKRESPMTKVKKPLPTEPETSDPALIRKIQQLESEKEALRLELWKHKRRPSGKIGYALLLFGTIALISSILYSSYILAFVGIALTFWGALLLFIKPATYMKASLLDSTAISSLTTIDHIISELNYKGKSIHLPPRYLKELKGGKVFIPSKKQIITPPIEEVAKEKVFLKNPKGICLTPPGLGLVNLFENELGTDFIRADLNYLQNNLPKLFIEGLEIAEDFELNIEDDMIQVKITGSIYKDFCKEARKLPNICGSLGCPLCSSIAIALTRATGKPVIIEKTEVPKDGKTIEANFRLLETIESEKPTEALPEAIELHPSRLLPNLASLFLTAFGSITLAWVGQLTWYDMTTWGKDIALIFFGSRTGEAISLGIGMKVIYYFLIGLALLLSGLLTYLRRKRSKV